MSDLQLKPAILMLEDGRVFHGTSAGATGTITGEICFNTGMTGYQEIFTDPSYFGQIMVMTNAHIGNYGTLPEESESGSVKIRGLVCKNFNTYFSRQIAGTTSLQEFLESENIPAIGDIDTRALVRHIRNKGAMNAVISDQFFDVEELRIILENTASMEGLELASQVCTKEPYYYGDPTAEFKVAVMDYGVKKSILKNLSRCGFYLKVFPAQLSIQEVNLWEPNGYFLSNGPGDPAAMDYTIPHVKSMIQSGKPVFGICLGHQLIARAVGITTYKMHHGHRGINHPVKNILTGLCEITSQNHGFAVDLDSANKMTNAVDITHVNLNDGTMEGMRLKGANVFSVQYHPEASPGPHDSHYLFDQFYGMVRNAAPKLAHT